MISGLQLNHLASQVFGYSESEFGHRIGFLVDVPPVPGDDTDEWKERRAMAMHCARVLANFQHACMVYAYQSVGRHNADLTHPVHAIALDDDIPVSAGDLDAYRGEVCEVADVFNRAEFWLVFTQFSATVPIKQAAARFGFRAIVLSGISKRMLPALSIDVNEVDRRVDKLTRALTDAHTAEIIFDVRGKKYTLSVDLRYRMGFGICGCMRCHGQVVCLPPGEAYIAPYESEKNGLISFTSGELPIQKNGDIALCEVSENRVICIDGDNPLANALRQNMSREPACANVAKLGFGILADWGIQPIGHSLYDEKLSFHIGLGRSEYLGGVTSPSDFRNHKNVSHTDYIYHPMLMPDIRIHRSALLFKDREAVCMADNRYLFDDL